jgi:hypothetical protein
MGRSVTDSIRYFADATSDLSRVHNGQQLSPTLCRRYWKTSQSGSASIGKVKCVDLPESTK